MPDVPLLPRPSRCDRFDHLLDLRRHLRAIFLEKADEIGAAIGMRIDEGMPDAGLRCEMRFISICRKTKVALVGSPEAVLRSRKGAK